MAYDSYTDSRGTTIVNYGYIVKVWSRLSSIINNNNGLAAIMGNLYSESFIVPYIVQGNISYPFSYSITYTDNVNNGTISENDFVYNGPNGGGYGLAQWTYKTRKQGLYDMWRKSSYTSIGDIDLACDYLIHELQNNFTNVLSYLNSNATLFDKTKYVLQNFENPSNQSIGVQNLRYDRAYAIYEYVTQTSPTDPPDDGSGTGGGGGGGNNPVSTKGYFSKRHGKVWMCMKQRFFNRRTGQWQ